MTIGTERIVAQLTSILESMRDSTGSSGLQGHAARRIIVRSRAAVERLAPPGSPYIEEVEMALGGGAASSWQAEEVAAVVEALRDDYESGALQSIAELVHADLFDDLLEMAQELFTKGFTGPAAVLAGSVLEEHLRKLAAKVAVPLQDDKGRSRSVEAISVDIRKQGTLTEVQRKSVQAWYAIRSEAAHGRFDALVAEDVERMIDGIRDFIARYPA